MKKQINVAISEEAYDAAKVAAEERGMLLRKWVERVLLDAGANPSATQIRLREPAIRERTHEPMENIP